MLNLIPQTKMCFNHRLCYPILSQIHLNHKGWLLEDLFVKSYVRATPGGYTFRKILAVQLTISSLNIHATLLFPYWLQYLILFTFLAGSYQSKNTSKASNLRNNLQRQGKKKSLFWFLLIVCLCACSRLLSLICPGFSASWPYLAFRHRPSTTLNSHMTRIKWEEKTNNSLHKINCQLINCVPLKITNILYRFLFNRILRNINAKEKYLEDDKL